MSFLERAQGSGSTQGLVANIWPESDVLSKIPRTVGANVEEYLYSTVALHLTSQSARWLCLVEPNAESLNALMQGYEE